MSLMGCGIQLSAILACIKDVDYFFVDIVYYVILISNCGKTVQGDTAPREPEFGDCFLASSFGLVGRTTTAMQPRQGVGILR